MKRLLPAYPLWIVDPLFSVWSPSDELAAADTQFWTGKEKKAYGFVRYGEKTYCFMGRMEGAEPLVQTDVRVSAFATEYDFTAEAFELKVRFVSPLLPDDLQLMSCPVCYTEYEIREKGAPKGSVTTKRRKSSAASCPKRVTRRRFSPAGAICLCRTRTT